MKKLLLALPLVAGASWAGSTYYAGTQAQPAYEKLLSDLNETAAGLFVLETDQYTAGFTQSTAITNVKLQGLPEPVLLKLQHDIQHTPIGSDPKGARFSASSITTTLLQDNIENEALRRIVASFEGGEPFVLYSDVAFNGNVTSDLQLNKITTATDSGTFSFDGGRYESTSHNDQIIISGVLGQINFKDISGNGVTIARSTSNFDLVSVAQGVYTGEQLVTFPSVQLKSEMWGQNISIKDFILDSSSNVNGETLNTKTGLAIASIDSPLPLNSVDWTFELEGLSVNGLERYIAEMNRLSELDDSDWNNNPSAFEANIKDAFAGLLSPGTVFTNKLTLSNDGGDVISDMNVSFPGDGSGSGLDSVATVRDLLQSVTVDLALNADAPAIDMTPAAMFMMHPVAQQYIVTDGQTYTSTINIADLMLDINGNLQSLEPMLGSQLDMPLDFSSAMADY